MMRALWIVALVAMLMPVAALAEPIIIIINSYHNLRYATGACSFTHDAAGIADCKTVGDTRSLGRMLENEVMSRMTTNTRCQGVDVFRQTDYNYDGKNNLNELADPMKQGHWSLHLDYNPGRTNHNWTLFPYTGGEVPKIQNGVVSGEGTVSQVADQICIVVMKRGANIH
jgi:hypothetical protein